MDENSKSLLAQPDQQDEDSRNEPEQISNKELQKNEISHSDKLLLPPEQAVKERTIPIEPDSPLNKDEKSQQAIHSHGGTPKASRASFGNIVLEADQKLNGENSHIRRAMNAGRHGGNNGLAFMKGLVSYWRKDLHELSHEELLEVRWLEIMGVIRF